jgi:hypothetical protein
VRVCESGIDRYEDWRHWRSGAGAAQRPSEAGGVGNADEDDGEPGFGVDWDVSGVSGPRDLRYLLWTNRPVELSGTSAEITLGSG